MNILIIDDEKELSRFLEEILTEKGHSVDLAFHGKQGLDYIQNRSYEIIFTDHNMPEMSGLELVKYVKEKKIAAKVVMMTGYPAINEFFVKTLGADEFLPKPFTVEAIEKILKKYEP